MTPFAALLSIGLCLCVYLWYVVAVKITERYSDGNPWTAFWTAFWPLLLAADLAYALGVLIVSIIAPKYFYGEKDDDA